MVNDVLGISSESSEALRAAEEEDVKTGITEELAAARREIEQEQPVGAASPTAIDEALDEFQRQFPSIPPEQFYRIVADQMGTFGIDAETLSADEQLLNVFLSEIEDEFANKAKQLEAAGAEGIHTRLIALKTEGVSLQASLQAIRTEFNGQIGEETSAVLAQFEALFSEAILPDKDERKAVEALFYARAVSDFTPAVFTGFVATLYEQPDSLISEETKERIEKKFQIPRRAIATGQELLSLTLAKDDGGKPLHHSPETALRLQEGMSSYVAPNGEVVVIYMIPNHPPRTLFAGNERSWSGEASALGVNYGLVRAAVSDELDQMTGLFGGRQDTSDFDPYVREEAAKKANRFFGLLVGKLDPDQLIWDGGIDSFRASLNALVDPTNQTDAENMADLRKLGVVSGGGFDWNRVEKIGQILRQNHFFQAQGQRDPMAPHLLIQEELRHLDPHEKEQNEGGAVK